MSRCARCGLPEGHEHDAADGSHCASRLAYDDEGAAVIVCRDRQIAAQAALLRSVTGKLECALEFLGDIGDPAAAISARLLVETVLEVLS